MLYVTCRSKNKSNSNNYNNSEVIIAKIRVISTSYNNSADVRLTGGGGESESPAVIAISSDPPVTDRTMAADRKSVV